MPIVFQHHKNSSVSFALWQITETEEFFRSYLQLTQQDLVRISACKLEHKRLEKWACRAIVAELTQNPIVCVEYDGNGKPYINNQQISFSHSHGMAAVAISPKPIGIDIEQNTDRFLQLYSKFLNDEEVLRIGKNHDIEKLCFYWCAKEAMYKLSPPNPYNLRKNIQIVTENSGFIIDNDVKKKMMIERYSFQNYQIALAKWPQ